MNLNKIFVLVFMFLIYSGCSERNSPVITSIDSNWEFKSSKDSIFLPASIPGTVHLDLLKNKKIDDPFYRLNEHDLQWIDKLDWHYKTTFEVNDFHHKYENIELDFLGLDTYCDVFLNDSLIYESSNMFIGKTINIKDLVKIGKNKLDLKFKSPINVGIEKFDNLGYLLPENANDLSEIGKVSGNKKVGVFTRKAPYSFGWDWGPRLVTSGIWRPINLNFWNNYNIEDLHFTYDIKNDDALINAEIEINSTIARSDVKLEIKSDEEKILAHLIHLEKGVNEITIPFTLKNIKKWWPNGMGDQKLYDIQVSLSNENYTTNSSKSIGLRSIELITEKDTIGNNFYFKINGIPTFMKGVNYIPQDVFTPRVKAHDYEEILQSAVDANMNMVRVWGGGIYEEDIFYDLCDKYGLLVWQDFMFACAMYPGDEEFLNSVKEEAIYNVKRIRTHPSLALWCGNNEVLSAWENWGWKKSVINDQSQEIADKIYTSYDDLFHNILPNVIEKYDSNTAYWPSSPGSSFGKKESLTSGDAHYWGVWWGKEPFTNYENKIPRFMSEFGFQSFPDFTSVLKYTNDSDHNIYSEVMKSHQRSSIGNETIEEYMLREYRKPNSFKNFLYVSQLLQAEGISMGMEAHRRNRDICMGSLYWQLNDCWPVASWSSIDYYGKWKALHYKTRESFATNLISFHKKIDEFDIYYVTDSLAESNLTLNLEMIDFKGNLIKSWTKTFKSKANNSKKVLSVNYKSLLLNDDFLRDKYLQAKVYSGNNLITKKTEYLTDFKNLNLTKPDFKYDVFINKEFFEISLVSKNLVKNLFLTSSTDSNFSDNYFDLIPNEEKLIKIKREKFKSINNFKEGLTFISLYDTY